MKRLADYSQYFLRSPELIKELVGHSNVRKNDLVYDIGAGSGAISAVLATRAAKVIAIETEPRMADKLRQNMKRYEAVTVVETDFLTMPLPNVGYKVFSNIPFHISAAIVRRLVFTDRQPKAAYLIVQKQFAQKLLIGRSPFTGQLGAEIAPWMGVRIRRPLRRTDYWPHPNVDTVLIELKPHPEPLLPLKDEARYRKMIADSFHDPRYFHSLPLAKAGVSSERKPSQLGVEEWVKLFHAQ